MFLIFISSSSRVASKPIYAPSRGKVCTATNNTGPLKVVPNNNHTAIEWSPKWYRLRGYTIYCHKRWGFLILIVILSKFYFWNNARQRLSHFLPGHFQHARDLADSRSQTRVVSLLPGQVRVLNFRARCVQPSLCPSTFINFSLTHSHRAVSTRKV